MQENSSFISENASGAVMQSSAPQEKANAFLLSIGALLLVAIISGVFMVLTMMTNNSIATNNETITAKKAEITTLKSEPKNAVAALVDGNSIYTSIHLSTLITALSDIANAYEVQLQNFSIKNNEIQTNLIAVNSDKDAVQKIIKMMQAFARAGGQSAFSLEPILSVTGDRMTRTTPITFKIVPKVETPITPTDSTETPSN